MKQSAGKSTWPGRKQVWRVVERDTAARDVIGLHTQSPPENAGALLEPVMRNGRRVSPPTSLDDARQHRAEMVSLMPAAFRELSTPVDYLVERSATIGVTG